MRGTSIFVMMLWAIATAVNVWSFANSRHPVSAAIATIAFCAFVINGVAEIYHTVKESK